VKAVEGVWEEVEEVVEAAWEEAEEAVAVVVGVVEVEGVEAGAVVVAVGK
jgi:hypothetical protein